MLIVPDSAPMRRDINSDEMRRIHPEITETLTHAEKVAHMKLCDQVAYEDIRNEYPNLLPPGKRKEKNPVARKDT